MDHLLVHYCNTASPLEHLGNLPDTCYMGMFMMPFIGLMLAFGFIMFIENTFNGS